MVQWLRLRVPNAGDPGFILGQATTSHMPQPGVRKLQLRAGAAKKKKKMLTEGHRGEPYRLKAATRMLIKHSVQA